MEILFILLIVLLVVTLVGHGIWVLFAWMFGGGRRQRPPAVPQYTVGMELAAAEDQVRRLFREGRIGRAAYQELTNAIEFERTGTIPTTSALAASAAQRRAAEAGQPDGASILPPPLPAYPFRQATADADDALETAARDATSSPSASGGQIEDAPFGPIAPDDSPQDGPDERGYWAPAGNIDQSPATQPAAPEFASPPLPIAPPPPLRPVAPPREPSRTWSEVLAAFMEQKNIRWGELVGGLLIIGCTVALVLSFWTEIALRPVLKFSIFTAVTGALFVLGLYTEHRWRLPTTSRGVLLIATLLVPLNFLAFAALGAGEQAAHAVAVIGQSIAFGLFLWLSYAAAKVLAPRWPGLLAGTVMALSALSLAVRYFGTSGVGGMTTPTLVTLAGLPLLAYALAHAAMLKSARRWTPFDADAGHAVLTFVGVASFAAVFPVALVLYKSGDANGTARTLAPLLGLAGIPLLASGLLMWRRINDAALANLRTAGTAVGIAGAAVMVASIALAWPNPAGMIPAALFAWLATTGIALRLRVPSAQWLAAPCAALAYLLGFHVVAGHVGWTADSHTLFRTLLLPAGGTALAGLVFAFAVAGEIFFRRGRQDDADAYRIAAALTGAASLALATAGGFGRADDPSGLTWLYAGYAVGSFYVAWRFFRENAAWIGWGLVLAASAQALLSHNAPSGTWTLSLLALATAAGLVTVLAESWGQARSIVFGRPARAVLTLASAFAALFVLARSSTASADAAALRLAWLAALWLAVSLVRGSKPWFLAGQGALTLAVAFAAVGRIAPRYWFANAAHPLLEPWAWQIVGIALATLSLGWAALRTAVLTLDRPPASAAGQSDDPDLANAERASVQPATPLAPWRKSAIDLARVTWSVDLCVTLLLGIGLFLSSIWAATLAIAGEFGLNTGAAVRSGPSIAQLHAMGVGAWTLLAALLALAVIAFREGFRVWGVQGAMTLTWTACLLIAARAWPTEAGASALRVCSAGYLVLGAAAIALLVRRSKRRLDEPAAPNRTNLDEAARPLFVLLGAFPIFFLSAATVVTLLTGSSLGGPAVNSFFSRMGTALNYGVPLAVVVGLLLVGAIRRRCDRRWLATVLAADITAFTMYVTSTVPTQGAFAFEQWIRLAHVLVATTALGALAWTAAIRRDARLGDAQPRRPVALSGCVVVALAAMAVLAMFGGGQLLVAGGYRGATSAIAPLGDLWAWVALIAISLAAGARFFVRRLLPSLGTLAVALTVGAAMAAFTAANWDSGNWLAFHTWMAAHAAAGWAILAIGWVIHRRHRGVAEPANFGGASENDSKAVAPAAPVTLQYQRAETSADPAPQPVAAQVVFAGIEDVRHAAARWAAALGVFGVVLSLRAMLGDPWMPWASVATIGAFALLTTTIACWLDRPRYLYGSSLLLNLGATLWWVGNPLRLAGDPLANLILVNVIALAVPALAWLVLEVQVFVRQPAAESRWPRITRLPVHKPAASVSLVAIASMATLGVAADLGAQTLRANPLLAWAALGSVFALLTGLLWDRTSKNALAGLYALGLVGLLMLLDQLNLPNDRVPWMAGLLLGGYTLVTGLLYSTRAALARLIVEAADRQHSAWLAPANVSLALVVLGLALLSGLTNESMPMRLAAAGAAAAQVASIALLARGRSEGSLRIHALLIAVASAVLLAWAWPGPFTPDDLRARVTHGILATAVLAVATAALYVLGIAQPRPDQRSADWRAAARAVFGSVAAFAAIAMLLTFAMEAVQFLASTTLPKRAAMHPVGIGAMLLALAGSCATALWWAIIPLRDPFDLTERGRMGYVYAAEVLAALAYAHIKLTCPPILPSLFVRFWPVVVMAICFAGVGVGEIFRRQGRRVLYEPFERTGLFLPLLALMAFWFVPSQAHYSGVLLAAGAVYAAASVLRRSFAFGLLAALAGNGALWYLLHRSESLGLLNHPQLWVIPAALSVLAAAQLNRDRLAPEQLRTIRYLSLIALYVSSTADIFLNAATPSPWLPVLLAVLSVGGVLAGVVYRIRPFLFVGTLFLAFAVAAMIWNAQVNLGWTWLWYVAGILVGLMIIAMFAVFEKRRAEMVALLDGLRAWE